MKQELIMNIHRFIEKIIQIKNDIYEASMEKLKWADDDIINTMADDMFDYLLYLSTDKLYIKDINVNEKIFLKNLYDIFKENNIEKMDCNYNFDIFLSTNIGSYNSWLKKSKIAREIKFPLSYQERLNTIPFSLQQLCCYDQKYNSLNRALYCVYYYDIYKMLGDEYLLINKNNKERKNKNESFLKHIDNSTFKGLKLSEYKNVNNNISDFGI